MRPAPLGASPLRVLLTSAAVAAAIGATACEDPPLDTTRQVEPRGTLGEEIFKLFHKDLARDAPPRAAGFMSEREGFVGAIDHLVPDNELSRTQDFLLRLLPLYDDGSLPNLTRTIAQVADRLAADRDATRSLAALMNREGYVAPAHQEALILRIARFPKYRALTKKLMDLALAHDGLDANGAPDEDEDDSIRRLLAALANGMKTAELSEDAERDIVLMADLMLKEDMRLGTATATGATIVARDQRGLARVAVRNGGVPSPFVDRAPADSLPDIDPDGRFLDANGQPLVLPPFGQLGLRDPRARAIEAGSSAPIYEYVELDRTISAGLMRDGRKMVRDGVPMKAIRTAEVLLGQRSAEGLYVARQSRVMDLAYAAGVAMDVPDLPDVLELTKVLIEDHEATLTHLLVETQKQLDTADRYDVSLRQGSTFFDDLMSVIRKILLEPGLAEALLDAIENDPATLGFPAAAAQLAEHKKDLITAQDFASNGIFVTPVDRNQPDRGANASLHQRVLHLIYDTKGARYEPRFSGVPLGFIFEIPDLAEFYMLSIIGEAQVPQLVSRLTGLSERPSPEELAHFINTDQQFGNPRGNEGIDVKANDGDTLFAASASGMTDALRPLVRIFHSRQKLDLLFELFRVLHLHWATPEGDYQDQSGNMPRYSKLSGIRWYEPLLIDTFRNTHVLEALKKLLIEGRSIRTTGGKSARDLLLSFARKFLLKDSQLLTRDGAREVTSDGQRITPLSPFDLIRGARSSIKTAVKRSAQSKADYDALIDALHETFLETEAAGPEAGRFKNPRTKPIAAALVGFLETRARKHAMRQELSKWLRTDMPKSIEDAITSEELPAVFDLIHTIEADDELEGMLIELRDELLDEDKGFGDLLAILGDTLGSAKDARLGVPFVQFLGREIHPDHEQKLLYVLLTRGKQAIAADPDEHMLEVVRRGLDPAPAPKGGLYMYGLSRAIRQTNRSNPGAATPLDGEDVRKIVEIIARYMKDDQHGLEKFYELVKNRK